MDLRVLGPVEAAVDDHPVAIGAGKPRALLAMLGAQRGLAGLVRGADRRAVGRGAAGDRAEDGAGLRLAAAQGARRQRQRRGDRHPRPRLRAAARRRRGRRPPLRAAASPRARRARRSRCGAARRSTTSPTEPFAPLEIRRLEELRLAAVELAIDQDLAAGRHAEVVGELEALVAQRAAARAPARPSACSRSTAAAARPTRSRPTAERATALVDAIGVEPGPELRRLHEAILRQDPSLDLPAAAAELPPELDARHAAVRPRRRARRAARALARAPRPATAPSCWSPARRGIGKTRLAAELAAEVQRDGGARPLRVRRRRRREAARRVIEQARVARRPTLLVVDDVDHAPGEVTAELRARRPSRSARCSCSPPREDAPARRR